MNQITTKVSIDLSQYAAPVVINATCGDSARSIEFSFFDHCKTVTLSDNCTAVFAAKKPDGTCIMHTCSIVENSVIYHFTAQTCSCPGRSICQIHLYTSSGNLLTTPAFFLQVRESIIHADDKIISESEENILKWLVSQVKCINNTLAKYK